ncbi:hypothetical protein [Candidatus Macondimonas diazotrophica]|jgi:hypothetical protein|uniref:Uncharacterized protein n=1 Tax=Candidatus Macondimonas diazotrophica TaxID=2305248 RepID=A0A4Z0F7S0_9GAMM|nr:hypothetical protein [Candidatus Macondimonas diazotrophica]NCU00129.1 hypothetical protein [Candidatus Macondimonas diazotrophica]TFZ81788.1 hypothetical protein E4680_10790 [Candidatus Macondimonas diazotrophica]HBG51060.1 hypothetical protein [Gammaproteobacteria bacterium]
MAVIILSLQLLAVAALFFSWKQRRPVAAGVALIATLAALILWVSRDGPEYAAVYWLVSWTVLAWVAVFLNREFRHAPVEPKARQRAPRAGLAQAGRAIGPFVLAGPLAGLAALLVGVAGAAGLPGDPADRLVVAMLLFLVIWPTLTFWALAAPNRVRPLMTMVGLAGASGLVLHMAVPG